MSFPDYSKIEMQITEPVTLKFCDRYLAGLERGKELGYDKGYANGYTEGYDRGLSELIEKAKAKESS